MDSIKLVKAFEFSSLKHRHQKRKGKFEHPYFSHVAAVATLLAKYNYDNEVVIAGILHDTLEDTDTTYDELASNFGKQVSDLVQDVSENKSLPYNERKIAYIQHLEKTETRKEAAAISCCDLIANMNSLLLEEEHIGGIIKQTNNYLSKRIGEDFSKTITVYRRNVIAEKLGSGAPVVVELDGVLEKVFLLV